MSLVDFMLSTRQQKVLAPLLMNPDRQFGTNELIALSGTGVGAGRNVLSGLERSGVVTKTRRGNQLLYAVNTRSPIFRELRSICMKTFGLASVVSRELETFRDRIQVAFLYGSVVRGEDRPDSDVDVMIVGSLDIFELSTAIETMRDLLSREIHLALYTPSEWKALESDRVVRSIREGKKIVLIG